MENFDKKTLLILAGGLGSRYKGLKQTETLLETGETLLEFSIYDAIKAGFNKFVIIINQFFDEKYLERLQNVSVKNNVELRFVHQYNHSFLPKKFATILENRKKPFGTAHAVICAKDFINEPFVTINADDFYGRNSYEKISRSIENKQITRNTYELIAYEISKTLSENGTVSRGVLWFDENKNLLKIVEHHKIQRKNSAIISEDNGEVLHDNQLISMNFWCFHPSIFSFFEEKFYQFLENYKNDDSEFQIPTAIQDLMSDKLINVKVNTSDSQWFGMTYPEDKNLVLSFIKQNMKANIYPSKLW